MSRIKILLADAIVKLADILNEKADRFRYKPYFCQVCNSNVQGFTPYNGFKPFQDNMFRFSVFTMETFNFNNYRCPVCNANDRDRLTILYLKEAFLKWDTSKKYKFIEFAPETVSLASFIKSRPFLEYRSADLYMKGVDDQVDLQDLSIYTDNSVDMFLCSHILEHVPDDKKAMRELYRILKPGGKGIVLVPIQLDQKTIHENDKITDPAERWREFGQDTHLRVYSKQGFVGRLEEAGFKVEQLGKEHFGEEIFNKSGIYPRSVLYVIGK